jgi:hypothetical protein
VRPNNQPIVGGSGRGDVLLEAGCRVLRRGYHPIIWGDNGKDEKIMKIKYIVALDGY